MEKTYLLFCMKKNKMTIEEAVKLLQEKLTKEELLALDDLFDREGAWSVENALADKIYEQQNKQQSKSP